MSQFADFGLDPKLLKNLEKLQFTTPTPIQLQAIPPVLKAQDVAGLAQTGTGKTGAFVIPLIDRWLKSQEAGNTTGFPNWRGSNFILILVPTRELADQVYENIQKFSEGLGCQSVAVYGGTSYDKQREAFRNHVDFVVATPGRLIDLYKEHLVDLKQVRAIVFDEADRMFDLGFKDDMKYILQRVPQDRQFLVFSATLNFDVLNVAYQFGAQPVEINISRDSAKAENVKDEIFHVGHEAKPQFLLSLLRKQKPKQTIVFSNYKHLVERIAQFLSRNGIPAMGISSLLTQNQRMRVLELFKAENEANVLVATDLAARGLDIQGVDLVINYDLPQDPESYVHRIGRTGRAGQAGLAWSMVSDRDVESLSRIHEYLKHNLPVGWLDDEHLVKEFAAFPDDRPPRRPEHSPRSRDHRRPPHGGGPRRGGGGQTEARSDQRRQGHKPHRSQSSRPSNGAKPHSGAKPSGGAHSQKPAQHRNQPRKPMNGAATKAAPARSAAAPQGLKKKVTGLIQKLFGSKKPTSRKNP